MKSMALSRKQTKNVVLSCCRRKIDKFPLIHSIPLTFYDISFEIRCRAIDQIIEFTKFQCFGTFDAHETTNVNLKEKVPTIYVVPK